ncbi:hypothetical protein DW352_16170 [Pseudolabrys taiwanensis]|uniref:Uncharacterized protein n=1 Tax=Pseudolabrys taiwanensis TaxID=331696 RepID=A0A345ZYC9_9HYPH|nr:hypothetical protein [Pseudolabrys taiwanensis]AXK81926.1 hypothetical protein DW352_16170 [Pseudolabrys taiwanensis]
MADTLRYLPFGADDSMPVGVYRMRTSSKETSHYQAQMTIAITIDCNAWNDFFNSGMDLVAELPPGDFSLFMPREIEIEIQAIPDVSKDGCSNRALKDYIYDTIARHSVTTVGYFGFAEADCYLGFNQGTFMSDNERNWYATEIPKRVLGKKRTGSDLPKNMADTAVAASSFYTVILTADSKPGPIKDAYKAGGKVIYLKDFHAQTLSLRDFIKAQLP